MGKAHAIRLRWPLGAALVAAVAGLASPAWAACTTPGQVPCGANYCVWNRQTCCDSVGHPESYCPYGRACSTDGTSCLGNPITCGVGMVGVISSCGSEECTCQSTCSGNTSCSTGCCAPTANGNKTSYCAPSCVCQGLGALIAYCGSTPVQADAGIDASGHDAGKGDGGSSAEPAGPSADPFGPGCDKHKGKDGGVVVTPLMAALVLGGLGRRRRK